MSQLAIDSNCPTISRITHIVLLLLLLCGLPGAAALAQTPTSVEQFVERQVRAGEDVVLDQEKPRDIRAKFLGDLIESYKPPTNRPYRGISIENAEISGDFDLKAISVPYRLALENCKFNGAVNFFASSFQKGLSLRGAIFKGPAAFYQISVDGDLRINKAHFKSKTETNFDSIKVTGNTFFYYTKFDGPVNLSNSNLEKLECAGEDQEYGHTEFRSSANFYGLRVVGDASFTHASFDSTVDFGSVDVGKNLELTGVHFTNPSVDIEFYSMRVGGNAIFNYAKFLGGFDLGKAQVVGNLEFTKTEVMNPNRTKAFSGINVGSFILDGAVLAAPYDLQGANYHTLTRTSGGRDASLDLIEASTYRTDTYIYLEAYYRRIGLDGAADDVHVAGKKRERDEAFSRQGIANLPQYLGSWIFYIAAGYGKHKELALVWSIVFIGIGYCVFREEKHMMVQRAEDASRYKGKYHPLWYSIALFLPIVDLEDAKTWAPRVERRKSRFYMRLHIILGYLLIPIGLAAWTGLIK